MVMRRWPRDRSTVLLAVIRSEAHNRIYRIQHKWIKNGRTASEPGR